MIDQKDVDEMNDAIARWTKDNLADLKGKIASLGIKHYPHSPNPQPLAKALSSQLRKNFGMVNRISYRMPRSAIFLHKGVSKGHPKHNPRKAKEWYAPVVDKNIERLTDIVADAHGSIVINNLKIK